MWTCFLPMRITRMNRGTTMNGIIFTISSLKNKISLRQGTWIKFRNRLETVSVIPWKKVLNPTSESFRGPWRVNPIAWNGIERNGIMRKISLTKPPKKLNKTICPYRKNSLFWHYIFHFWLPCFEKMIQNKKIPVPTNTQSWERVIFREMLRNKITKVCFYFCYTEWNSELFSLLRIGSEWSSESLLPLCSRVRNSKHFSLLRNDSERNSEVFCLAEQNICFVCSVFCGIIFCGKFLSLFQTDQLILWVKMFKRCN